MSRVYKLANQDWTTLASRFPVTFGDKTIHLIGVHHKSLASVERVRELLPKIKPTLVCLEVVPRIKDAKFRVLDSTLEMTNTKLSDEMIESIKLTNKLNAQLAFIDEPLQNIINNTGMVLEAKQKFQLRNRPKLPLLFKVMTLISFKRRIKNDLVNDSTSIGDMKTYCRLLRLKDDTIEKRDACMALRIFELMKGHSVGVAVVGKSHVFGIEHFLNRLHGKY